MVWEKVELHVMMDKGKLLVKEGELPIIHAVWGERELLAVVEEEGEPMTSGSSHFMIQGD